jgi:hypothetical protein
VSDSETKHEEVKPEDGAIMVLDPDRVAREITRRFEIIDRMEAMINQKIDPARDLEMVHGNPCRNKRCAIRLHRRFGGNFEWCKDEHGVPVVIRKDFTDTKGPYYIYEAYGRYYSPIFKEWIETSGFCSSRHAFFAKTTDGEGNDVWKQPDEINEANIRQMAMTETFKKAVFLGLGLGPLDMEELEGLGVAVGEITGYKGKKAGAKGGAEKLDGAQTGKLGEIEKMCMDMYKMGAKSEETGKPFTSHLAVLKEATRGDKFDGYRSYKAISAKNMGRTHSDVKKLHAKFSAAVDAENEAPAPTAAGPDEAMDNGAPDNGPF